MTKMRSMWRRRFGTIANWAFLLVMVVIFGSSFLVDGDGNSIFRNQPIITFLAAVGLFCGMLWFYRALPKIRYVRKITVGIFILLFLSELYIGNVLAVSPTWDFGHVKEVAEQLINNSAFSGYAAQYVSNFPHQLMLAYIVAFVVKFVWKIGVVMPINDIMLWINIFCCFGTAVLLYLFTRKVFDKRKALFALVLVLLFSPLQLYIPILYSDTASMFCIMLGACLVLELASIMKKKDVGRRKMVLLSLGLGATIFVGMQIKITAVIPLIGMVLYVLLIKKDVQWKAVGLIATGVVVIMVPLMLAWGHYRDNRVNKDLEIPKTHWIMMGMRGIGSFNMDDYNLTWTAQAEGADLGAVHKEEIKKRLEGFGVLGYLEFLTHKIAYTWGDGTYFVSDKLAREPLHTGGLASKIFRRTGEYNWIYVIVANIVQGFMLITLLVGAIVTRKDYGWGIILKMAVIGVFLFLCLWETRSRYLLNMIPIFILMIIYFMDKFSRKSFKEILRRRK